MKANFSQHKPNYRSYNHGRGGQYHGRGSGQRGGQRFYNNNYNQDRNRRPRSFGGEGIDGPLSTDRDNRERRPHSFGGNQRGPQGDIKPKKPASMIEYKEAPLPNPVQVAKELLLQVANFAAMEEGETVSERLLGLAGAMADSDDLKEFCDGISDIFAECLSALPAQIPVIATLTSLLSGRGEVGPVFAARVLDRLGARLSEAFAVGDVLTTKLVLRAFACLSSSGSLAVDGTSGLCALLDVFLDVAYAAWDSATGLAPDGRAAIYLLAHTLPWSLGALLKSESGSERVGRSMLLFARVVSEWTSPFSPTGSKAVFLYDAVPEDAADGTAHISLGPAAGPVCWDTLWEASKYAMDMITQAQSHGVAAAPACMSAVWELPEVAHELSPTSLSIEPSVFDQLKGFATRRELFCNTGTESSWLRPCFSIFDSSCSPQAAETCAQLSPAEKVLALDYCRDVTHFFSPVIRFNGTRAGTLDTLGAQLVALRKLFPTCSHFQYVLMEALLAAAVSVPCDPAKHALISRIILELCKKEETIRPVVALGASVLFNMSSDLDWTLWRSVADWLGFHLVNTKVSWPYWTQWAEDLQAYQNGSDDSFAAENALFLTSVIQKCTRILQPDIVKEALPVGLQSLVPGPVITRCSLFARAAGSETEEVAEQTKELLNMVRARVSADDVEQWLEALTLAGDDTENELLKIKLLVQSLFEEGKGAFSVFTSLVDRYGEVLRMYTDGGPTTKLATVEYVDQVFVDCSDRYRFLIALDYLIRKGVVSVDALAAYTTSPAHVYGLSSQPWLFQVIQQTVDRTADILQASAKLYASTRSVGAVTRSAQAENAEDQNDDDDLAVIGARRHDDEGDDDTDGRRRRADEDDADDADVEPEQDPSETVREALESALTSAGAVYNTLLCNLFSSIVPKSTSEQDTALVSTAHKSAVLSLITYVSRALHSARADVLRTPGIADITDANFLNIPAVRATLQSSGDSLQSNGLEEYLSFFKSSVSRWEHTL